MKTYQNQHRPIRKWRRRSRPGVSMLQTRLSGPPSVMWMMLSLCRSALEIPRGREGNQSTPQPSKCVSVGNSPHETCRWPPQRSFSQLAKPWRRPTTSSHPVLPSQTACFVGWGPCASEAQRKSILSRASSSLHMLDGLCCTATFACGTGRTPGRELPQVGHRRVSPGRPRRAAWGWWKAGLGIASAAAGEAAPDVD